MKTFAKHAAVVASLAIFAPALSTAAQLSFLNNSIAMRIPAKDLPAFRSTVGQVLNDVPDGSSKEWTSQPGRDKQPVKVAFKPLQTTQTKSAGTCRLLSADVSQRATSENWRFWFCKQADGSWKASGNGQP